MELHVWSKTLYVFVRTRIQEYIEFQSFNMQTIESLKQKDRIQKAAHGVCMCVFSDFVLEVRQSLRS